MASTTKAQWGVTATISGVSGVVTDFSESHETMLGTQQNEVGSVIQQAMYDKKTTINATIEVPANTDVPAEGSQITVGSNQYYVTNATLQENNTSYRKISVTAERYARCNSTDDVIGDTKKA